MRDLALMIPNAVGIVIYLHLASRGWRIPEEHGMIPVTGEPFIWAFALPVLGAFLVLNTVWGVSIARFRERQRWLWWGLTGGAWIVALGVDFAHH